MFEVIMTVRRTFVEEKLSEEPEAFLAEVPRSQVDWEWRVVPT